MLLRFEASNFRSILEPVELSMIAVDRDRSAAREFDLLAERVLAVEPGIRPAPVKFDAEIVRNTTIFQLTAIGSDADYTQKYLRAVVDEYMDARKEMRSERWPLPSPFPIGRLRRPWAGPAARVLVTYGRECAVRFVIASGDRQSCLPDGGGRRAGRTGRICRSRKLRGQARAAGTAATPPA